MVSSSSRYAKGLMTDKIGHTMKDTAIQEVTQPAPMDKVQAMPPEALATLRKDEQLIASLQARIIVLEGASKGEKPEKKACSDAEFESAIAKLESDAKADRESDSPRAAPIVSLLSVLKFIPDMTKEQKALWTPRKLAMVKAHSELHRRLLGERKAVLARVTRNPNAIIGTVLRTRKDKTVSRVSLTAREPAKRKPGKGMPKAKPAQVAGKVPVAANAQNPAKVA